MASEGEREQLWKVKRGLVREGGAVVVYCDLARPGEAWGGLGRPGEAWGGPAVGGSQVLLHHLLLLLPYFGQVPRFQQKGSNLESLKQHWRPRLALIPIQARPPAHTSLVHCPSLLTYVFCYPNMCLPSEPY